MYWEIIATILGALGGWEAIKYLINRKTNKRVAEAGGRRRCLHESKQIPI